MKKKFKTKKIKDEKQVKVDDKKDIQEVEKFYNGNHFVQPKATHSRTVILSMLVAVVFGFVAGMLSLLLFLSGTFSHIKIFSWLDVDALLPTAHIVIEKQEETTVIEDERIVEVAEEASSVVVGIFNYQTSTGNIQKDIYKSENFLGNGLILTNDGWIVTTNDVIQVDGKYTIATQDHQLYEVQQIERDGNLGLIFLKVEAENLPVISMAQLQDVNVGQRVMTIKGLDYFNKDLEVSRVASCNFPLIRKLIRNTENYYIYISLIQDVNKEFWGTPVFNLNKQVIGLLSNYNNQDYVIPVDYLKKSFNQLLTLKEIKRTYLGIEYIDLSSVVGPDINQVGALITNIKKDSPLIKLDVDIGDIITKIDEDMINGNKNFTNLIQEYRAGDKISLTIVDKDDKTEKIVEVELK